MMGDDMFELCSVSVFPQKALEAGRIPEAIVATCFDVGQELLWTATEGGWVSAFDVPTMERHASVHAHDARVLGLKPLLGDMGLLSLSQACLKLHSHGGLQHYACPDEAGDLTCMETDHLGHQVILGRSSNKLSCVDVTRGRIIGDMDTTTGTSCICSSGTSMVCGSSTGEVVVRDLRTGLHSQHSVRAHSGPVACMHAHRHLLATCGWSLRGGQTMLDAVVKVFDIRSGARALTHVPFHAGCTALQFHPKFSATMLLMGGNGTLHVTDANDAGVGGRSFQVDCEGDYLYCCDISSTGEAFAFGDGGGYAHLWSNRPDPQVNEASCLTLKAGATVAHNMLDWNVPLSALPVYFSHELPFSTLPPNQTMRVGMPPHKIDSNLLKNIRQVEFVGYVANPEYKRGGQPLEATRKVAALRNARVRGRTEEELEYNKNRLQVESILPKGYHRVVVTKDISKKGYEEFDFHAHNTTCFAGLENGMRNCYVNPLLQALYFVPWFRAETLKHICHNEFCLTCELSFLFHMLRIGATSTVCQASNLLRSLKQIREAAALGLLENALSDSMQAANTPANTPSHKPNTLLGARIQSFSRFVLEQTMKEMTLGQKGPAPTTTVPAALFGSTVDTTTRCLNSKTPHSPSRRETLSLHFDLHYPSVRGPHRPTFATLLHQSICQATETRGWCDQCRSYQHLQQTKTLRTCADVILVNTNLSQPHDLYWWGVSMEVLGLSSTPPSSPQRPGAKSAPSSPAKLPVLARKLSQTPTTHTSAKEEEEAEPWLPPVIGIEIDSATGATRIVQGADVAEVRNQMRGGEGDVAGASAAYELVHVISHIKQGDLEPEEEAGMNPAELRKRRQERDEGHLVAHVRPHSVYYEQPSMMTPHKGTLGLSPLPLDKMRAQTPQTHSPMASVASSPSAPTPPPRGKEAAEADQWMLFNDFCVTPTSSRETRRMYGKHKAPCLVFYQRVDLPSPPALPTSQITAAMYQQLTPDPRSLNLPPPHTFAPLDMQTEAPYPGMLLAIDCEFVSYAPAEKEIYEDGTEVETRAALLGLGRVSVVRGDDGAREGECLIDDYVRTVEPVYDYLTRFSGLVMGDLDPGSSKHHLTSLKHAYLKLRYLADVGCKFVGHGLKKDFRMANIVIPVSNIIDTVEIYHFKRQRKLSLRFLASYLLRMDIQSNTHNSIEDAVVALRLYKKYLALEKAGTFQETLLEIYRYGKKHNWEIQQQ